MDSSLREQRLELRDMWYRARLRWSVWGAEGSRALGGAKYSFDGSS